MTVELLGIEAGANSCTTHLGPIGIKNGKHAKYIQSWDFRKDNEKGFRQCQGDTRPYQHQRSGGGTRETGGDAPQHGGRMGSRVDGG